VAAKDRAHDFPENTHRSLPIENGLSEGQNGSFRRLASPDQDR
jgi:hypothetical protein